VKKNRAGKRFSDCRHNSCKSLRGRDLNPQPDDKDPLLVMLARTWPGYDRLRRDSRFLEIVSHLTFPGWNLQSERGAMLNQCA
jgi:hypothetical protein